jgi:hypothetical protein
MISIPIMQNVDPHNVISISIMHTSDSLILIARSITHNYDSPNVISISITHNSNSPNVISSSIMHNSDSPNVILGFIMHLMSPGTLTRLIDGVHLYRLYISIMNLALTGVSSDRPSSSSLPELPEAPINV